VLGAVFKGGFRFAKTPMNKLLIFFGIFCYVQLWRGSFFLDTALPLSISDPRFSHDGVLGQRLPDPGGGQVERFVRGEVDLTPGFGLGDDAAEQAADRDPHVVVSDVDADGVAGVRRHRYHDGGPAQAAQPVSAGAAGVLLDDPARGQLGDERGHGRA